MVVALIVPERFVDGYTLLTTVEPVHRSITKESKGSPRLTSSTSRTAGSFSKSKCVEHGAGVWRMGQVCGAWSRCVSGLLHIMSMSIGV